MENPYPLFKKVKEPASSKIEVAEIMKAQRDLYDHFHTVHRTQLARSNPLSDKYKANIYLKREDQQRGRTHKIRGSYHKYKISTPEQREKGFVCASDGNFATSLAILAGHFQFKAILFVPSVCNKYKIETMKRYGQNYIEIKMHDGNFETATAAAKEYAQTHGMVLMHPFDDLDIITGYATIAAEVVEDCSNSIDYVLVPSGGGGLITGIGSYFKQISPRTEIVAVEPEGANPMYLSLKQNKIVKVEASRYCDGSSVKQVGQHPFEICKNVIDEFLTVTEGKIAETIISLYTQGVISQPSGAMAVAALEQIKDKIVGKTVVCIVSGANTDLSRLDEAKEKSMISKGYKNYYLISLPNKPGIMADLLLKCINDNDVVASIEYKKKPNKQQSQALLAIESKSQEDVDFTVKKFKEMNIKFENINLKSEMLDLFF